MSQLPPDHAARRSPWTRLCADEIKSLDRLVTTSNNPAIAVVVATEAFDAWFQGLAAGDARAVARAVGLLEARGTVLGFPYSSAIEGSRFALRELRAQSGGRPLRVLYAFDPKRRAVLLVGGDKTGDERFYKRLVPQAETLWIRFLESLRNEVQT